MKSSYLLGPISSPSLTIRTKSFEVTRGRGLRLFGFVRMMKMQRGCSLSRFCSSRCTRCKFARLSFAFVQSCLVMAFHTF